jgi:hypothetical protein
MMGPVKQVAGFAATLAHERIEVEDTAVACLRFASGALGVIQATTSVHPGLPKTIAVHGERGTVIIEQEDILRWDFEPETLADLATRERFARKVGASGGASDPTAISHVVTAHFGNWEMGGYVLLVLGFQTYAVARPLDNPFLDEFLKRFRERTGQKILAKKGDFEQMQHILSSGGVIATLGDQDAGQRGLFVDFFGRPASTHKAIALLSLQYQAPLLVVLPHNTGKPLHYGAGIEESILPEDYAKDPDAVRAITQRFTAAVERKVRAHPGQYFWLHRRWKHQPAKSKRRVA